MGGRAYRRFSRNKLQANVKSWFQTMYSEFFLAVQNVCWFFGMLVEEKHTIDWEKKCGEKQHQKLSMNECNNHASSLSTLVKLAKHCRHALFSFFFKLLNRKHFYNICCTMIVFCFKIICFVHRFYFFSTQLYAARNVASNDSLCVKISK